MERANRTSLEKTPREQTRRGAGEKEFLVTMKATECLEHCSGRVGSVAHGIIEADISPAVLYQLFDHPGKTTMFETKCCASGL
jgi:hypothetical protein